MRTALVMLAVFGVLGLSACDTIGEPRREREPVPVISGEAEGTIQDIDPRARRLTLRDESQYQSNLRTGDAAGVVYYDDATRVEYQGRQYRAEDLERGDRIRAHLRGRDDRRVAETIEVLRNVNGPGYRSMHGTIHSVDTHRRTIEIDSAYLGESFDTRPRTSARIAYDERTVVEYRGRTYDVTNLERGDVVDIDVDAAGPDRWIARRIVVARSS